MALMTYFSSAADGAPAGGDTGPASFGFDIPSQVTAPTINETVVRLRKLGRQWRDLGDGDAIILTYTGTGHDRAGAES